MILVTGASGQLGSTIMSHLSNTSTTVVGASRQPTNSQRRMDFDVRATLDFTDVEVLIFISAGAAEDDVVIARHGAVIDAAERDGVGHVVYTSLTGAGDHLSFAMPHRWTERRLQRSSLPWTILRNGLYAELFAALATPHKGVIGGAFGEGRLAAVTRDDLARAAANVATDPTRHRGKIYELTGEVTIGAEDVAQSLEATYAPQSLGQVRESLDYTPGLLPFQPPMLLSLHSAIAHGFLDKTSPDLRHLLGEAPTDPMVAFRS